MEKREIKSVDLANEGGYTYCVGESSGITKIEEATKNGEMAEITYYKIYKGDKLFADVHHFSRVIYK